MREGNRQRGWRAVALVPGLLIFCCLVASEAQLLAMPEPSRGDTSLRNLGRRLFAEKTRSVTFTHRVRNSGATSLEDVDVVIALPRDDERQTVHSIAYTTEPVEITTDGWEQKSAHFTIASIPAGGEAEIRMKVSVTLKAVEWLILDGDVGVRSEIPEKVARHYLRDQETYHLSDKALREAAQSARLEEKGVLEQVRRIHDLVIDRLQYRRDDRWDPADSVLRRGDGSCSEYAYVMIALCRLNGIPARYAGGSWCEIPAWAAPSGGGAGPVEVDRIFHRWVEVYLPRIGWYPIDPTQDDGASAEGEPYRYFGKLPWHYLTMAHGDGDKLEGGLLGSEYRSNMRWRQGQRVADGQVFVDRYAVWSTPEADPGLSARAGN